ncbi:hypothetical protein Gotur_028824 [Gossypium turneri]
MKKKVDVFALGIYGLMIFPRALGYIYEAVTDLFDGLNRGSHLSRQIWLKRLDL